MSRIRSFAATLLALVPLALGFAPDVARAETRIGLVIGNSEYQAGALATAANDAGLIAQTLQAAGFDVVGARDLDQDALRRALRDFVEKATSAGPDTVAFIYVNGYGLQLEGENYVVPVDAKIARDTDVAAQAVRMSDYIRPLAALKLKATVVVLDAARANPFVQSGPALAGGLALVEPEPGMLVAFNAAPGTVAPQPQGSSYGSYAQALAEMIREGGLPLADVFDRVRLRVNDASKGAEVPWHASKVESKLVFFERAPDAPPLAVTSEQTAAIQARPIREFSAQDAYAAALQRDTLEGYQDFLAAYPDDAMAKRVRALVATRREAITWRRTCADNTTAAYWSYLRRYPQGPHAMDARRRLTVLAAALEPPPSFAAIDYGLPPPPPEEIVYVRRPVLAFDDPEYAFAPPPPAPVVFLAPPPREFIVLEPPPPPVGIYVLPMPVYRPVPVWVRPPVYVARPPANNIIYNNVHNTVVINNVTNTAVITNRSGQTTTVGPQAPAAQPVASARKGAAPTPAPAPATVAAIGPALPPSVAQKAATQQALRSPGGAAQPAAQPGASPAPGQAVAPSPAQPGRPLPGMQGQPLPAKPPSPTAATTPTAPGTPKPGTAAPPSPATAAKPGTPPPAPGATGNAKPGAPSQPPAARLAPSPSQPGTSQPATSPAGNAKPGTPPPAARLAPPQSGSAKPVAPSPPVPPSSNARPATPPNPAAATPPAAKPTPPPVAARPTPPAPPPAARLAPPPAAAPKPVAPPPPSAARVAPPPAPAARVAPPAAPPPVARPTPPQAPPVARPAAPPPPALAGARPAVPAPPPAARPAAPQPRGCPPGKTMAVVNGQPACR